MYLDSLLKKLYGMLLIVEQINMPPKIIKLATLIRDYEGGPGDRNFRNKNPGNCRYFVGGYLKKYGVVAKDKDGFAIFETYELGWAYLCNMLKAWAGGSRANWTILRLMQSYAPKEDDNDPKAYADYITKHLGLSSETLLKDLLV